MIQSMWARFRAMEQRVRGQRGSVLVVVASSMLALTSVLALAIDVGLMTTARLEAQRAADAAALAGAGAVISSPGNGGLARVLASDYAGRNDVRFDAVALRRAAQVNSISGLCITKLDVLDGLETLRICTAYKYKGETLDLLPVGADVIEKCEPVYEDMPGWTQSTVGVRNKSDLPENAINYLNRLEEVVGVPIDIISTGPERDETIILRNPYE